METVFFLIFFFTTVVINIVLTQKVNEILHVSNRNYKSIREEIEECIKKLHKLHDKIDDVEIDIDRSMLALRENLEPAKPMKTNNWDSMREAFKGPVRIEVNERN